MKTDQQLDADTQTYLECIERLMQSRSSKQVSNGKPQHAAALFQLFFRHASQSVKIFCKDLDNRVFEDKQVIEAAADALKRGVALDIIIQEAPKSPTFLERTRVLDKKESIRMELIDHAGRKFPAIGKLKANFAVMDEVSYRLEDDSSVLKATACMNDPKTAKQLLRGFNLLRSALA